MAILLTNFNRYWQTKANTDQKLVLQKPKQQAVILNYISKKEEVQKVIPEPPELEEVIEERACILASDIDLPYEWAEIIVRLRNIERPKIIPTSSWEKIETACFMLYDNNFALLKEIIAHNWSLYDIYGCSPSNPCTSFNVKGLVLLLRPIDVIIEVREECIKIRSYSGSINSFYRRLEENVKCVLLCDIN
ncbi:MAG: hypothetical protein FJX70_07110 [Alphaproteobacteria bacterium]|nr:hypothetical protein [Alphaproteobacteria bacterium]